MTQIRITNISGGTYPITVYIADVYGNNRAQIGIINPGPVPPEKDFNSGNSPIPPIFNTAPQIMLILKDANNCEIFKILDCTFGCAFEITIELANCVVDITIQDSSCNFGVTLTDPNCFINDLALSDPTCFINALSLSDPSCLIKDVTLSDPSC